MSPSSDDFVEVRPLTEQIKVTVAKGATVSVTGIGDVITALPNGRAAKLKDVLFIPERGCRLLSLPKMAAHGLVVEFGNRHCIVKRDNKVVVTARKVCNAYKYGGAGQDAMLVDHGHQPSERELWHARLGHPVWIVRARLSRRRSGFLRLWVRRAKVAAAASAARWR